MKIRSILAGTAVVGALAAGVAMSPAAANASTASAVTAQSNHFFGPYYSDYGRGEDRGHRSYFKGFWFKRNGYYYFDSFAFDRDHDHQYSYFWVRWHDGSGTHSSFYKTFNTFHYVHKFKGGHGFNDVDFRICEGSNRFDDCGSWHDVF
ncbi:hypothetical protein J5X84_13850 [Streptosporangiaceae bacterium NEAU-GS5]|nr:hypothetical protein [Streptosporangiaceae bacterium NEAU-GS5]